MVCLLGSPGGSRTNASRSTAFLGLAAHQLAARRTNVCVQASALACRTVLVCRYTRPSLAAAERIDAKNGPALRASL